MYAGIYCENVKAEIHLAESHFALSILLEPLQRKLRKLNYPQLEIIPGRAGRGGRGPGHVTTMEASHWLAGPGRGPTTAPLRATARGLARPRRGSQERCQDVLASIEADTGHMSGNSQSQGNVSTRDH